MSYGAAIRESNVPNTVVAPSVVGSTFLLVFVRAKIADIPPYTLLSPSVR